MNPSSTERSSGNLVGAAFLVLCGILRSTDLFFRTPVLQQLPVPVIIMWEHLISTALLLPLLWIHRREYTKVTWRDSLCFLFIGVGASALGILCFTAAFKSMNPALVILLQKTQPLVTISLGAWMLEERMAPGFLRWALLAICASYFVSFSLTNPFTEEWSRVGRGVLLALAASFFWGSGTVWGKRLLGTFPGNFVLVNRFLIGSLFAFGLASWLHPDQMGFGILLGGESPLLPKLIYMAWVPGLLAVFFFYRGLRWVEASISSILELAYPISAVFIMWYWFRQPLDGVQITAAVVLFAAILRITLSGTHPPDAA